MTAATFASPQAAPDVDAAPLHPAPRWTDVLRAQLGTTRDAIRRETMLIGGFLLAVGLMLLVSRAGTSAPSDMQFAEVTLPLMIAALFGPVAVWRGEEPARRSYFWAMPADRWSHTLIKVFSGWAWLMAIAAAYLLWAVALARLSGGVLSMGDTNVPINPEAPRTPDNVFFHPWPVPGWMWVVPFTGATILYLLGSIVVISSNHPWRWFGGIALAAMLVVAMQFQWGNQLVVAIAEGRYGLEVLLTGSVTRETLVSAPGGVRVPASHLAPMPGLWATATLLWFSVALAGLVAASRPHHEG